ncbi:MAG TPA: hypothetical protein VIK22_03015 [Candidatus Anoxymicrobiaceae bacterium]
MRRFLVVLLFTVLVIGLVMSIGCGGKTVVTQNSGVTEQTTPKKNSNDEEIKALLIRYDDASRITPQGRQSSCLGKGGGNVSQEVIHEKDFY